MRRYAYVSALVMLSVSALAAGVSAQAEGWITVSAPDAWVDNQVLNATAGSRIRVVGQAYHPNGIESITVAGSAATMRRAAAGIVDFEAEVAAASGVNTVRIVARALGGQTVNKELRIAVTGTAPAGARTEATTPVVTRPMLSPGSAFTRSLFVPGLGQFYAKQPVLGAVFLGAGVGALVVGVGSTRTTTHLSCLSPASANGTCPSPGASRDEKEKHMLIPGLAGFAAVAVISAVHARSAATKANASRSGGNDNDGGFDFAATPSPNHPGRININLWQLRF